jgi:hypothetical protein
MELVIINYMDEIPDDVWETHILSKLLPDHITMLSLTSKKFKELCKDKRKFELFNILNTNYVKYIINWSEKQRDLIREYIDEIYFSIEFVNIRDYVEIYDCLILLHEMGIHIDEYVNNYLCYSSKTLNFVWDTYGFNRRNLNQLTQSVVGTGDIDTIKRFIKLSDSTEGIQYLAYEFNHQHVIEWWPYANNLTEQQIEWLELNG